jgi:hypothetical protein
MDKVNETVTGMLSSTHDFVSLDCFLAIDMIVTKKRMIRNTRTSDCSIGGAQSRSLAQSANQNNVGNVHSDSQQGSCSVHSP